MAPHNGEAKPPSAPEDLPFFVEGLRRRLAAQGAAAVGAEVAWMAKPVAGFRVTLAEGERRETFGVPVRVLAADRAGATLDRIVADALRRLRR